MPTQITWLDILTVIALISGPIVAVVIAQNMDVRRAKRERRMDVFRTLMRTRRFRLNPDHVGALNLVEIEFRDDAEVIARWKEYFEHLSTEPPRRTEEQIKDEMTREEKRERVRKYEDRIGKEREKLLAKLLYEIAKVLDFKIEQLEIFEGGYMPQGWEFVETEQQLIRRFLIGLSFGDFKLPVALTDYTRPVPGEPSKQKNDEAAP